MKSKVITPTPKEVVEAENLASAMVQLPLSEFITLAKTLGVTGNLNLTKMLEIQYCTLEKVSKDLMAKYFSKDSNEPKDKTAEAERVYNETCKYMQGAEERVAILKSLYKDLDIKR